MINRSTRFCCRILPRLVLRQVHTDRNATAMSSITYKGLVMDTTGEPLEVLRLKELEIKPPGEREVTVQILAAPVNPSDINTVQGKYPLRPKFNDVPGHEGVGRVVATGSGTSRLNVGDIVVPLTSGLGTWRTGGVYSEDSWHKINITSEEESDPAMINNLATVTINPATALCMLENFEQINPGDVVIQNGANSAVGKHVIRLCKNKGVKTVNVVRDRPDFKSLQDSLVALGADVVATPENVREACKAGGLVPKLALNCVGGESATTFSKILAAGGTLVTYGGMSMQPVTIPTPVLIFKNIKVRGFWISGGEASVDSKEKGALINRVVELMQKGVLRAECERVPLDKWQQVMEDVNSGSKTKYLLVPG